MPSVQGATPDIRVAPGARASRPRLGRRDALSIGSLRVSMEVMCPMWGIIALLFGLLAHGPAQATEQPQSPHKAFDTPPAPVLTPAQALGSFALAPGFAIEAVAAEPLIEDPVAITWDEAGNLYAAEMRGFMPDTYGTGQTAAVGAVVRLTDQDGDGVYDRREVLADQLVLPRAVAIVNEGLLIAEPPNLWLCPNTDGSAATIDCDGRISLGAYGDQPGSVEHAENGLLMGLDNWLYSAKSARRLRILGGEVVSEPTLFRGQWGISKDNAGRLYYNTNSVLLLGDSYDAQAVVRAGNSAAPGLNVRISENDSMFAVRVNTGVNRAYVPGVLREDGRLDQPTSASGMAVYRGDQFGREHADDVFVAEPAANAVARLRLTRDGLKVSAEHVLYPDDQWTQREFLASTDERFRPVDAKVGPDGALYVVDFYRGVIQDHVFISDELRAQAKERGLERPLGMGRIWRVSRQDGERPEREFTAVAAPDALLAWLGHPNGWQARHRPAPADCRPGTRAPAAAGGNRCNRHAAGGGTRPVDAARSRRTGQGGCPSGLGAWRCQGAAGQLGGRRGPHVRNGIVEAHVRAGGSGLHATPDPVAGAPCRIACRQGAPYPVTRRGPGQRLQARRNPSGGFRRGVELSEGIARHWRLECRNRSNHGLCDPARQPGPAW